MLQLGDDGDLSAVQYSMGLRAHIPYRSGKMMEVHDTAMPAC
jgi:hypothetical protein